MFPTGFPHLWQILRIQAHCSIVSLQFGQGSVANKVLALLPSVFFDKFSIFLNFNVIN
jgi:hypothetical protein